MKSVMDLMYESMKRILPSLSDQEREEWNNHALELIPDEGLGPSESQKHRLMIMAGWISRCDTERRQVEQKQGVPYSPDKYHQPGADMNDSQITAAFRVTSGLVMTTTYAPSREKKWSKSGREMGSLTSLRPAKHSPEFSLTYSKDGSKFDWTSGMRP